MTEVISSYLAKRPFPNRSRLACFAHFRDALWTATYECISISAFWLFLSLSQRDMSITGRTRFVLGKIFFCSFNHLNPCRKSVKLVVHLNDRRNGWAKRNPKIYMILIFDAKLRFALWASLRGAIFSEFFKLSLQGLNI